MEKSVENVNVESTNVENTKNNEFTTIRVRKTALEKLKQLKKTEDRNLSDTLERLINLLTSQTQ